jgi:hypothetical protein
MVSYIVQLAQGTLRLIDEVERAQIPDQYIARLRRVVPECRTLVDEVERLDPRDFLPDSQHEYIQAKIDMELWVKQWAPEDTGGTCVNQFFQQPQSREEIRNPLKRIIAVLDKYGGEGWRMRTRSFSFLKDKGLRDIIERDYRELTLVLFPGGAWKSTVIMAGSILEAILFDILGSDPKVNAKALASLVAPKDKHGVVMPLEDWRLAYLISVAADIGLLPSDRAATFDQVLRDYRNFVHPKKEIRSGHPCGEGEAQLAVGGLNAVCDILK